MNVKTFQGPSMAEALAKVKQEMGSAAVILHTRSFKRGGLMGLGARAVVEITAGADVKVAPRRRLGGRAAEAQGSQSLGSKDGGGTAVLEEPAVDRHPLRSAYGATRPGGGGADGGGCDGGGGRQNEHSHAGTGGQRDEGASV